MFIFSLRCGRAAALLAVGLGTSCASREVPARFPENSPASVEAPAGEPAAVLRALEADPGPLPTQGRPASAHVPGNVPNAQEGNHGHQH